MNSTLETIAKRRSIRKYKSDPIPPQDLNLILEAARQAPTGNNTQNWQMIVVQDPDMRRKTAAASGNQMWIADAAAILCVVTPPGDGAINATIVLDHAILAAASLGYGTCWIGIEQSEAVKQVLGIPHAYGIWCLTPVGVPAETPTAPARKTPAQLFLHDHFGNPFN
jgi:nitroreductase